MGFRGTSYSVFLLILLANLAAKSNQALLEVPGYGLLNGTDETSIENERPFYAFRSVFYAEMPDSETRFLPPLPRNPYPMDEVQNVTSNTFGCSQAPFLGGEDCLSLSIYTPNVPSVTGNNSLLPVMFWIHGGSFRAGQALEYLPGRFMDYDIVLVVIQYRLGPLGFLCFDTDEVPGNAGLFDQLEALNWTSKFIQHFGGDPKMVTIAGESAGSASVSILLQAPQAAGLFHRAIGESGSSLAEWAVDRDGRGKEASLKIAEIAGCPLEPYEDLLECVRTIEARDLIQAYSIYHDEEVARGGLGFSGSNPVIQIAGKQRILDVEPRGQFVSGNYTKVPLMFGANKQEGVLVLGYMYKDYMKPNNLTEDEDFMRNDAIGVILNALHIRDDTGVLTDALIDKYMVGAEMGNFTSMTPGLTDICSVLFLKSPGYEMVRLHARHHPQSYWYSFNFEGRNSLFVYLFAGNWPPIPHGVNHGDEMIYMFVYPFPSTPPLLNETEKVLSKRMLKVWTNFVIHGDPTPDGDEVLNEIPKFLPYDRTDEYYMAIDHDWERKTDYTKAYTVTVDELRP